MHAFGISTPSGSGNAAPLRDINAPLVPAACSASIDFLHFQKRVVTNDVAVIAHEAANTDCGATVDLLGADHLVASLAVASLEHLARKFARRILGTTTIPVRNHGFLL